MRIRDANSDDVPEIERIINQHWVVNIDHNKELQNPNSILLVAEEESIGKLLGIALMWIISWNKTGYLVELAVENSMKRKGIGSKIVMALVERARQNSLRSIIVETQIGRKESIDFYLSQGFRMSGYSDRYYTYSPESSDDIPIFFALDVQS
jgi:N-acetylglutamate synthase-like GNAT family acetyltransferase